MPGKPIATLTCMTVCPMCSGTVPHIGGPIAGPGQPTVLINGIPAAVLGDICTCVGPPATIVQGEPTVLINGTPVATLGSMTSHGGSVMQGDATVMISSAKPTAKATMPIKKIPFPKITPLKKVQASMVGKAADMKTAEENIEQIKKEAAEQMSITVTNLQWKKNGSTIENALINEEVLLCADVVGIADGDYLRLKVFEKDTQSEDDYVATESGQVQGGSVEISWKVKYIEDTDDAQSAQEMQDKGYTMPEYVFKHDNSNGETVESEVLNVEDCMEIRAIDEETDEPLANANFTISLPDGEFIQGELDDEGYARLEQVRASKDYPIVFYNDNKVYAARLQQKQ